MPVILTSSANIATLQAPDAYVQILNPPSYISGVATDVAACVGTASWGPLNTPVLMGTPNDAVRAFGRLSSAAVSGGAAGAADMKDLITDLLLAFTQAQSSQSTLTMWGVRVSDGTDVKATAALKDTVPVTGATATAIFSGTEGNNITVAFSQGSTATKFNVAVTSFPGGPDAEIYPNVVGGAAGVFFANLTSAINNGISGIRGPSQLIRLTAPSGTAVNPPVTGANQTITLAAGTDGRSTATLANQIGSDVAVPKTGLYALRNLSPKPAVAWLVGAVDNTTATAGVLASFGDSEGVITLYSNPTGITSVTATTNKQTWAQDTYNFIALKDHLFYFDPVNALVRLLPPYAVAGGRLCTLSPEISPLNKQVYGIIGTERNDPSSGTQQYSAAEIGLLNANGIMFITNPIPAGNVFGVRTGVNISSDAVKSPVEYGRMTNFLAGSYAGFIGKFVGQNQTSAKNDPLRNQVLTLFNQFHQDLVALAKIDSYQVICDLSNNTTSSIAKHFLFVNVKVKYLASVWYFIAQLQGGTTVVTQGSSPGQALQ